MLMYYTNIFVVFNNFFRLLVISEVNKQINVISKSANLLILDISSSIFLCYFFYVPLLLPYALSLNLENLYFFFHFTNRNALYM